MWYDSVHSIKEILSIEGNQDFAPSHLGILLRSVSLSVTTILFDANLKKKRFNDTF